jgi:universal stress protein A
MWNIPSLLDSSYFITIIKTSSLNYSPEENLKWRLILMFEPKKILVPTDFSGYSDNALKQAVDIAEKFNAKIVLLHVIDENFLQCAADYCISNEAVEQLKKEGTKTSEDKINKAINTLKGTTKVDISSVVKKGVPAEVILDEQLKSGIGLIVIASHGKTGILKHLIGSVTDKVVRTAKCPVMVIRA